MIRGSKFDLGIVTAGRHLSVEKGLKFRLMAGAESVPWLMPESVKDISGQQAAQAKKVCEFGTV